MDYIKNQSYSIMLKFQIIRFNTLSDFIAKSAPTFCISMEVVPSCWHITCIKLWNQSTFDEPLLGGVHAPWWRPRPSGTRQYYMIEAMDFLLCHVFRCMPAWRQNQECTYLLHVHGCIPDSLGHCLKFPVLVLRHHMLKIFKHTRSADTFEHKS